MKVSYFHGLESSQGGPKVQFLESLFDEVYAPIMDYRGKPGLFNEVLRLSRGSSLLVGSSIGGWFGYIISTKTGCPTLLFNPAVHSRSIDFDIQIGEMPSTHHVLLGNNDAVINPLKSRTWIAAHGVGNFIIRTYDGGHRVPLVVFQEAVRGIRV